MNMSSKWVWHNTTKLIVSLSIGGSRGGVCWAHAPPYRTKFFRFHIHFCRKAPTSEVHAPPTGNPGSATAKDIELHHKYDKFHQT